MSGKPTYEELEQIIRDLESGAPDLKNATTIPIEVAQIFMHCFENANVGVCLVEPDGDFIKVNNRMVEIFGYSKQEFEGMNVNDVSHPEDIAISKEVQRRVKDNEFESAVFQKRYIHKKGHMFWGQVSNSIVKNHQGKHLYFVTHFMEITESIKKDKELRKVQNRLESLVEERTAKLSKANKALRDSEKRLHTVIDQSPFPVAFTDTNDETIIYWSQSAIKMFGHKPNTVSEWYELAYPDPVYRKQVINRWKSLLEKASISNKAINTGEYDIVCKDGTVKVCEIYAQLIPGKLIVTLNDITERKIAEKSIVEQKQRAERYLNLAGVMFIGIDSNGNVNVANKKACELLECTKAEIINQNWFDNYIPERMRDDVRFVFKQLMEGEIDPVEYYENPVLTKSGKEKHIAWHNTVIVGEDDSIKGSLGSGVDISEKLKLQKQLNQAQKMEAIGNLAGGIAHDFNNILSSVIGFTELALDETPKGTTVEDSLQEVYSAGKRAKALVRQILAFARQSDEKISPIQPSAIAKEVLGFIRSTIPTTIEIHQEIESESFILGNATQVHQLLMNLCTNAAHAMENSGGVLNVNLKDVVLDKKDLLVGMRPGDYVEIKVSDTGAGIAPEIIESIFEPYFTTKGVGKGTGMGLAMVHGVIESYGGKIDVDSRLEKGTTFTINLPISKKRITQAVYVPEELPTGTERILIVDDEAPIVKMGSQILERLGYSVTTRTSSIEALELFQAKPEGFDLVVTDMTMPNLTGDKLAVELMKIRPDIPVILCTGYSKKISDEIASEIGINAFAFKPMVKADLAKTVRKVLDDKHLQLKAGRILFIDDEPQIRKLFIQKLGGSGYEIIEASSGKEGLKLYRERHPDLVITDLIMPEKEGLETITELKKENPNVKIIAISGGGRGDPGDYLYFAKNLGAKHTFSKPVDWLKLIDAVKEILN